jgi:predicted NUDIX family phosphoesterase
MNARISEDMKRNPATKFMRSYHGQFALREWSNEISEFETKPRKLNPMDENILVVPIERFRTLLSEARALEIPFFSIPLNELLRASVGRKRQIIEEDNSFVQIISLFAIIKADEALVYKRTSRLPEARLHHISSVNFGGHLQELDRAPLFEEFLHDNMDVVFMRELYEELVLEDGFASVRYVGSLYSEADPFSARHVGVCFVIEPKTKTIRSNEPGFHTGVQFEKIKKILERKADFDEWTYLVLRRAGLIDAT